MGSSKHKDCLFKVLFDHLPRWPSLQSLFGVSNFEKKQVPPWRRLACLLCIFWHYCAVVVRNIKYHADRQNLHITLIPINQSSMLI